MSSSSIVCPQCASTRTAPILYGHPTPEAMEAAQRGEIIIGGCFIDPDNPSHGCFDCDATWRSPTDPGDGPASPGRGGVRAPVRKKGSASAVLFDGNAGGTSVYLSLNVNRKNGVMISGSDLGRAPRRVFGSSEYEYWRTVKPEELDALFYKLLKDVDAPWEPFTLERLAEVIVDRFGGTVDAERNFTRWCDDHAIPTEFFSWTSGS